jgi:hypothetical protein
MIATVPNNSLQSETNADAFFPEMNRFVCSSLGVFYSLKKSSMAAAH